MRMYRDVNQLPQDTMHVTLIRCLSTVKKGYEVKGDGSVILYGSKNTK